MPVLPPHLSWRISCWAQQSVLILLWLVSRLKELKTTLHGNHGQGRNSDTGRSAGQQWNTSNTEIDTTERYIKTGVYKRRLLPRETI